MRIAPLILAAALVLTGAAPAAAASSPVYLALKACIDSNPDGGHVLEMFGDGPDNKWGAICEGATAANLWNTLYPYRVSEERKTHPDKSQTDLIHTGKNSYCVKVTRNADQTLGNHVECTLYLDLDSSIEKAISPD